MLLSQPVTLLDFSLGSKVSKLPNVRPPFKASGTWKWFGKVTCCLNSVDCTGASEVETSVTLAVLETSANASTGIFIKVIQLEKNQKEWSRKKINNRILGDSGFCQYDSIKCGIISAQKNLGVN